MLGYHNTVETFSDDARYFVAPDGGFFVTAKDGTMRHVDQLGKQSLFIAVLSIIRCFSAFASLTHGFPCSRFGACYGD